jgi:hypothetical protein
MKINLLEVMKDSVMELAGIFDVCVSVSAKGVMLAYC